MKLSGIEWPWNGKPIYRTDFLFEHSSMAFELISRFADIFSGKIFTGGAVSPGISPGSINISSLIAYDNDGRRIQFSDIENLQISRSEADSVVVVRHRFQETSSQSLDSTGYAINYRTNSFEILFLESALSNDIPLAQIRNISGNVTIIADLRNWRRMDGRLLEQNSIQSEKLAANINIGSLNELAESFTELARQSITNALNFLMLKIESLAQATNTINDFLVNELQNLYAPIDHTHEEKKEFHYIEYSGLSKNFTDVPNEPGTFVLYNVHAEVSGSVLATEIKIHGFIICITPMLGPGAFVPSSARGVCFRANDGWKNFEFSQ